MKTKHIIILFFSLLIGSVANAQTQNELNSQLFDAVEADSLEWVQELIEKGAFVNAEQSTITPLFLVNDVEIAKLLIENGADVNTKDYYGQTPLFHAEDVEIAKLLIENGADVNVEDNFGITLLHYSIYSISGLDVDLAELLIKNGCDINIFNKEDNKINEFFAAVICGDIEKTENLIKQGIDVNVRVRSHGITPLCYAKNVEIAKLLIENGADVNAKNNVGETPLFKTQSVEIAKLFIENGADVNAKSNYWGTPLFYEEDVEIAKLLIVNGANVNVKNNKGETPLFYAEDAEIAKLLIENGADVNAKNDDGETPLFEFWNIEISKLLIENGANVNVKNNDETTLLYKAYYTKAYVFGHLFINYGANLDYKISNDNSLLYKLSSENNLKEIEYLLQHYQPTIHNCPEIGKLPIHAAIEGHALETFNFWLDFEGIPNEKYKYIDTLLLYEVKNFNEPFWVKSLLLLGANPEYKGEDGKSAIDIAEFQDKKELLSILKNPNIIDILFEFELSEEIISNIQENEKNLYLQNESNYNILHLSIAYNEKEIMQYVLQQDTAKILINQKTDLGETPILLATLYNRTEMIPTLLFYSADANIPDKEGYTPYGLAKARKDTTLMQFFQNFDSIQILPRIIVPFNSDTYGDPLLANNYLLSRDYQTFFLWDTKSQKQILQIPFIKNQGYSHMEINFKLTDNFILFTDLNDFYKVDLITGRYLKTKIRGNVLDVNLNENLIFTYLKDSVLVWDLNSDQKINSFFFPIQNNQIYYNQLNLLTFFGQFNLLFSSMDNIINVINFKTGDTICVFNEHKYYIDGLDISSDGKTVASVDGGKHFFIWNIEDGKTLNSYNFENHLDSTSLSIYSPREIYNPGSRSESYVFLGYSVKLSLNKYLDKLFFTNKDTVYIFNLKTDNIEKESKISGYISQISSQKNDEAVIYLTYNQIKIVSLLDNTDSATFQGNSLSLTNIQFFNDSIKLKTIDDFSNINKNFIYCLNNNKITYISDKIWEAEEQNNKINSILKKIQNLFNSSNGVSSTMGWCSDITLTTNLTKTKCLKSENICLFNNNNNLLLYKTRFKEKIIRTFTGHSDGITAAAFSPNENLIVSGSEDKTLKLWDVATGRAIHTFTGHTATVNSVAFHPSGKFIFSAGDDDMLKIWSVDSLCELATVVFLDSTDWVVVAPNGLFDASENAMDKMHYVYGLEVIEFTQLKDRYYEPHLLQKLLGYEEGEIRSPSQGINNLRLYPEIKLNPIKDGILELDLQIREGGQGKLEIAINGKLENLYPKTFRISEDKMNKTIYYDLSKYQGFNNGENQISARVFNEDNLVASRWETINYYTEIAGTVSIPEFYALVVGTSDYSGSEIDLNYAADDADEFSNALQLAANKLFGEDHVHITTLTTNGTPPAKHRIEAAVAEFQQLTENDNVTPENTYFLCFFSGHGTSFGGSEGDFYYLTPEAYSFALADEAIRAERSISTQEMMNYFQKVSARKQVLILDACHSGQAIADLMAQRADISSNNIRLYENLRDKMGMFVLAGSAADAASYEATRYGQGLLTYSLLSGMAGQALVENQYVDVAKLFDFTGEQVPLLAKGLGGIQKPQIYRPANGQSFLIGQLTSNELKNISVNKEKTILLRTVFLQDRPPMDFLRISEKVNTELKNLAESGEEDFVFFDADNFDGAVSITGIYKNKGTEIEVEIYIYQGVTELVTFTLKAATAEDLSKQIVQKTLETLRL